MKLNYNSLILNVLLLFSLFEFIRCGSFSAPSSNHIYGISNRLNKVQNNHPKRAIPSKGSQESDINRHDGLENESPSPINAGSRSVILEQRQHNSGSLIQNLPQEYNPGGFDSIQNSQMGQRSLKHFALSNYLIAADVEGGLHAINRQSGQIFWSITSSQFNPLIDIREPPRSNTSEILMVEPFEHGNIYYFNMYQGLQKIPVSIEELISSSPMHLKAKLVVDDIGTVIDDEKTYTGSRKTVMYTIDIFTGEIVSVFGPGTDNKKYKNGNVSKPYLTADNLLVVGKTIYELGIHSKDGSTYNVTYSTWQPNSLDQDLASQNVVSQDGVMITPFKDKSILAIDTDYKIAKWVSPKFPGIITSIFDVFYDDIANENIIVPHSFQTIDKENIKIESIYLEETENHSWVALSAENFPSLVKAAPISKYASSETWRSPDIFFDDELFQDAITGVHTLSNPQYKPSFPKPNLESESKHSRPSNALMMIEPSNYNNFPTVREEPFNSLERYISPAELELYRLQLEKQITRQLLEQNKHSVFYKLGNLIYKIVESGLILLLSVVLLGLLQKFKITPPLPVILEKLGLTTSKELKLTHPEISESVDNIDIKNKSKKETNEKVEESESSQDENNHQITEKETKGVSMSPTASQSEKKKRKRGSRGGKKNKSKKPDQTESSDNIHFETNLKNLTVSDKILGYGSSGTVVFEGNFQGRPVAVKRMLVDFCDVADREIQLLTESDNHSNVIRYYCSEITDKFLYIALELCTSTLQSLIQGKNLTQELSQLQKSLDLINITKQIASGVSHLHSLKIIHRDLKPQNILVSLNKNTSVNGDSSGEQLKILISDFGLCKKLDSDQSSFKTNLNNPAGTTGWRAPELLEESVARILDSINEEGDEEEHSTNNHTNNMSVVSSGSFYDPYMKKRLTRAIDIFSLGCVFFYVFTKGQHPYGDRYMREANIIKGIYDLSPLKTHIKDKSTALEVTDLISQMISKNPKERPTASSILRHPIFWPASKKLAFLLKVSDRFEVERRNPPSPLLLKLETIAPNIILNGDWSSKFDASFMDNLGKYRKYNYNKIMDLLRSLRNKYHHFMDLPEDVAKDMGPIPDGFYHYFSIRFPNLLMEIYHITKETLEDDQMLKEFFQKDN